MTKLNIIKRGHIPYHGSETEFTNDMKIITERGNAIMIVPNEWAVHVNTQPIGSKSGEELECPNCGSIALSAIIKDDILTLECISCGIDDGKAFEGKVIRNG